MRPDVLVKLKLFFASRQDIVLAFLFGSQAKGQATTRSDFDVAVWPGGALDMDALNRLWVEVEQVVGREVDLVLLPKARPTVAWAALRGKKLLIRDYNLYLKLFLEISREAEDIQNFVLDVRRLKKEYQKA